MFDGLKKKFSSFIGSLSKKEEERAEEETLKEDKKEIKRIEGGPSSSSAKETQPKEESRDAHVGIAEKQHGASSHETEVLAVPAKPEENAPPTRRVEEASRKEARAAVPQRPQIKPEAPAAPSHPKPMEQSSPISAVREEKPKVTVGTKLKGIFLREIKISEGDIDPFMEQLRTSLLQSDVNYNAAEKILEEMRKELTGKPIPSRDVEREITGIIRNSILSTLGKGATKDIIQAVNEKRKTGDMPFRILFIGPNGAGKTTTIAKVASMLLRNGITCAISASDTFRAAAIEQTAYHAKKLGVEVVKGKYGSDPASIAFDAVSHAKASGIDVVLIDSAGRQETNKSLMEEMKKMVRVAKPDMKIFIGESITGNSLLEQVSQFKEAVGLDGIILTKLDTDAKGGNTLSILSETSVPILYFGIGERYEDLMPYDPEFIINNIVPN